MKIYDISQEILSCKVYPGDPAPCAESLQDMEKGDLYNLSKLSMCAHNGTHIDAPRHFIRDGKAIDEIPLDAFVGECYVARHSGDMTAGDAERFLERARECGAPERILISGDMTVTEEAAMVFAGSKIKLLGNESQTVGPADAPMKVHKTLLGSGVVLLEGIVLEGIPDGRYMLGAAPLNLRGFEGSPCRAWLIKE